MLQAVGNLLELFGGLFCGKVNRDNGLRLRRLDGKGRCLHRGGIHFNLFRVRVRRLWVAHNAVFFGNIAPVVPLRKGVFIVVNIALLGEASPVIDSGVAPVFLIHEILFCFFGQFQFVQLVDKVIAVIFLALDGGIKPVAIKVLCKIDKVFQISGILAKCYRRRKLCFVLVTLHFKQLA